MVTWPKPPIEPKPPVEPQKEDYKDNDKYQIVKKKYDKDMIDYNKQMDIYKEDLEDYFFRILSNYKIEV